MIRALGLCLALILAGGAARAGDLLIFAAASLQTVLDPVAADYAETTGRDIRISYASSAALARQIAAGAPADLFLSANADWMDWLDEAGRINEATRADVIGNALVLVRPVGARPTDRIALVEGRIAVGLTEAVPAGIYARAALTSLGLWDAARPHLVETENVRVALALVARGDVAQGIVYASDVAAEPRVSEVARFPATSHPPIIYPGAVIAGGKTEAAEAFLTHLQSEPVQAAFVAGGFQRLEPPND